MTAEPPSATAAPSLAGPAQADAAAPPPGSAKRRLACAAIIAIALIWIAILGSMAIFSANPVLLNRAQIAGADVVVSGQWQPGAPPHLQVEQVFKGSLDLQEVTIDGPLPEGKPTGLVLVPLTRIRRAGAEPAYQITQGELPNMAIGREPNAQQPLLGRMALVRPLVYPVSEDVLVQLKAILPAAKVPATTTDPP